MSDQRPDPDALLAHALADARSDHDGKLRIFFGYAAGVGKTYAMLEAARLSQKQGRDIVVGYLEPHARPETQQLATGLESLPVRQVDYRGVVLREFDLDAAMVRRPEILLVDELAHTNAPGSRHEKRWQDIEELLHAGIHVWTTLNVQHIETLNDVIGQVTGVRVRETIPDRVFDMAQELELVDVTPDELIKRLNAGKIYLPDQARRAIDAFFQRANLSALREMSFRQAARRVHSDVEMARREKAVPQPWATSERLLVCIGPSPTTSRVIRTAKRMAAALDAPWVAVSVDLTGQPISEEMRQRVAQHFQLAEQLGAETATLTGQNVAHALLDYARSRNVTKIFIGKTNQPRWKRFLFGTVVDEILDVSGEIDVYVIHGEADRAVLPRSQPRGRRFDGRASIRATLAIGAAGLVAYGMRRLQFADSEANTVMVFLAAVAWVAFQHDRAIAAYAALLAVLVFDFCFVPPYLTLAISDFEYLVTFAVMLSIGLVISSLTERWRVQVEATRQRERRTHMLYELGKQLSSVYGRVFLVQATGKKLAEMLNAEVAIYLQHETRVELIYGHETQIAKHAVSVSVATWVIENEQIAGAGTNTLPSAVGLFLPLHGAQSVPGAIAICAKEMSPLLEPEQRRLLESCANQLALALERDELAIAAAEARIAAEAEQVRSSLLSSVSHDLKTPLASIAGASSSLLESQSLDEPTRNMLLETIAQEAARLNRLLENVLQMSKLDAGAIQPQRQWHVVEELIGSALHRTQVELQHHVIELTIQQDLPLILVDGLLIEQVLINLLENVARYTPAGTRVRLKVSVDGRQIRMSVSDNGPGIPGELREKIFEKFFRATPLADGGRGSGLGLAICRAIARIHGGDVSATGSHDGGAEFVLRLPLEKMSPQISVE